MEKIKVSVSVGGQSFQLSGTEDESYIRSVASYADEKVQEIQKLNPALSTSACVLLAAINITDELFKLRQQYSELDGRISELRSITYPGTAVRDMGPKAPVKHPFEKQSEKA
ncbi:MAG: cell division protein ZapA [Eubacteriales bacterium]|nr:cell division protein ZapA [Eubacteriales bacterium]